MSSMVRVVPLFALLILVVVGCGVGDTGQPSGANGKADGTCVQGRCWDFNSGQCVSEGVPLSDGSGLVCRCGTSPFGGVVCAFEEVRRGAGKCVETWAC